MFGFNPLYIAAIEAVNGPSPSFALDFLAGGLNPSVVTFSRASNATQFDNQGRLVWAPAQGCSRGNMLSGSWAPSMTTDGTFTAGGSNNITGQPSGVATWTTPSPTTGVVGSFGVVAGTNSTFSIYLRRVNHRWVRVTLFSNAASSNAVRVWVDLDNKVLGASNAGGAAVLSGASITVEANGWVRVSVSGNCAWVDSTDGGLLVASASADNSVTRVGNGAAVEMCAPLLEPTSADSPKAWVPEFFTAGAQYYGPRLDYNPSTLAALGLLVEPARTNLNIESGLRGTTGTTATAGSIANFTVAGWPMVRFTADTSTNPHFFFGGTPSSIPAASSVYTVSAIVGQASNNFVQLATSANYPLDAANTYINVNTSTGVITQAGTAVTGAFIQALPSGAYRIGFSFTTSAAPTNGTAGVLAAIPNGTSVRLPNFTGASETICGGGFQFELGDFATSLIPTFGVSATRAEDVASPGVAWNTTKNSTWVVEFTLPLTPTGLFPAVFGLFDGAVTNRVQVNAQTGAGTARSGVRVDESGAPQVNNNTLPDVAQLESLKLVVSFADNNTRYCANGSVVTTESACVIPGIAALPNSRFGGTASTQSAIYARKFQYFPRNSFTNAELQALST